MILILRIWPVSNRVEESSADVVAGECQTFDFVLY